MIKKYDLEVLPFEITMGEETFMHYPDFREMSFETFYNKLKDGYMASTSQITPFKYVEYLEPLLKAGEDVLVFINGSGATTLMEQLIEFRKTYKHLADKGINVVASWVGEILTVQETAGFQMFMARCDEQELKYWNAPCNTPYKVVQ